MANYDKLKNDMAICDGERLGGYATPCRGQLYRCTACGAVGCRQNKENACSKQGFDVAFKCYACGAVGKEELVASGHEASKSAASTAERVANTD
ncbi:uncharacterized protein sS8_5418 [Methylocaldum marinum]|uniref:Uncharacterized protein n=1 Tax=Methylocaldum marinum TaxID=1432792 RepID=A0A250L0C7_9GAMM|nr:hypothetical protein [Methylocaldum marinum]BBA37335.1 uncharacterized protein sS8_5418 [Methylocaldum marinum]